MHTCMHTYIKCIHICMLPDVSVNVAKQDLSNDTRKQANAERRVLICPAPIQRTVDSSVC